MHLKSIMLAAVAALAFTGVANALTLEQVFEEVGGYHCSGSTCTSSSTVTDTREILISPAVSGDEVPYVNTDNPYQAGWWNEKCQTIAYVNADCTAQSLNQGTRGSRPAKYGSEEFDTCVTTSKEITYNGPKTSRDGAWSIDTSSSSSDGAC